MRYVETEIGEEYRDWKPGSNVFISSQTGSGKTSFILNTYLPYLANRGQRILFLVNRTVLKEEIETKIKNLRQQCRHSINVETYQSIESKLLKLHEHEYKSDYEIGYEAAIAQMPESSEKQKIQQVLWNARQYDTQMERYYFEHYSCVVCDECHRFLNEAIYDTATILSYNFIRRVFMNGIQIYMSATIEHMKQFIDEENKKIFFYKSEWLGISTGYNIAPPTVFMYPSKTNYKKDYRHIHVEILNSKYEIAQTVTTGKDKWLIFVDNKIFGEQLKKEIEDYNEEFCIKKSVSFITAGYKSDLSTIKEVDAIIHNEKQTVDVLIATSVLDNGINFNDVELRNLVIIADTEVQFLQMLGRKRFDGKMVNVYIFRQNKDYFVKRQKQIQKKMDVVDTYFREIKTSLEKYNFNNIQSNYELNKLEKQQIAYHHNKLMQELMNGKVSISTIQSAFFVYGGILHLNLLSYYQLDILNQYYQRMISEFEKNPDDAFLEEQFKWMGKGFDELIESQKGQFEKSKQIVINAISSFIEENKEKLKKEFLKNDSNKADAEDMAESEKYYISIGELTDLKDRYKKDFLNVLKKGEKEKKYKTHYSTIYKKGERMTKPCMEFLNKYCEIPYILDKENKKYKLKCTE